MRSTSDPRSPALRDNRSGAHVRMPLNLPLRMSARRVLNTSRCPTAFAEWDSLRISVISSPSRSAMRIISLICESIERTCCSSDSVDFLAYRQYATFIGGGELVGVAVAIGPLVRFVIPTLMTQRWYESRASETLAGTRRKDEEGKGFCLNFLPYSISQNFTKS